jgi:mycothiol synthase
MIAIREAETRRDLENWARVKGEVVPDEPVTADQLERRAAPGRLLVLAELDGVLAGCGIAERSSFGRRAFIAARVLPGFRRRGVGSSLVEALAAHARGLGLDGVNAFVDASEPGSIAFASRYGLEQVDYQLEQVRVVGAEPEPRPPDGVEFVALEGRREELLRLVWPIAEQGYAELPLPGAVDVPLDEWLRDEATLPAGSFAAFAGGEPVGYAGLLERPGTDVAEHGLTVVRRDRRGRGIGSALKRAELHWAARNGIRELVTWTQRGNEAMQTLNRRLGYVDRARVLTVQGPLP